MILFEKDMLDEESAEFNGIEYNTRKFSPEVHAELDKILAGMRINKEDKPAGLKGSVKEFNMVLSNDVLNGKRPGTRIKIKMGSIKTGSVNGGERYGNGVFLSICTNLNIADTSNAENKSKDCLSIGDINKILSRANHVLSEYNIPAIYRFDQKYEKTEKKLMHQFNDEYDNNCITFYTTEVIKDHPNPWQLSECGYTRRQISEAIRYWKTLLRNF